jgi:hypothetical protein
LDWNCATRSILPPATPGRGFWEKAGRERVRSREVMGIFIKIKRFCVEGNGANYSMYIIDLI